MKKEFLEMVKEFKDKKLIENHYKIILNGSYEDANELTMKNILEGFVIYEKLNF